MKLSLLRKLKNIKAQALRLSMSLNESRQIYPPQLVNDDDNRNPFVILEYATKVIHKDDPLYTSKMFEDARISEIQGLMSRGVFQVIDCPHVPDDANIVSARFMLTLNNVATANEKVKARFIAQGPGTWIRVYMCTALQALTISRFECLLSLQQLRTIVCSDTT